MKKTFCDICGKEIEEGEEGCQPTSKESLPTGVGSLEVSYVTGRSKDGWINKTTTTSYSFERWSVCNACLCEMTTWIRRRTIPLTETERQEIIDQNKCATGEWCDDCLTKACETGKGKAKFKTETALPPRTKVLGIRAD